MIHRLTRQALPAALAGAALLTVPLTARSQQQQQQRPDTHQSMQQNVGEGAPLYLSPSSVRLIQIKLNDIGYDPGTVDGQWGEQTSKAVRSFQTTKGLEPTGDLNAQTIQEIGLASVLKGEVADSVMPSDATRPMAQGIGVPLNVSPKTVEHVQQKLSDEGFRSGTDRGAFNSETKQALRQYQQKNGLAPTGTLTLSTLAQLGLRSELESENGPDMSRTEQDRQRMSNQNRPDSADRMSQTWPDSTDRTSQWPDSTDQTSSAMSNGTKTSGTQLYLSPEGVKQVQQALSDKGSRMDNVDGNWNSTSSAALKDFQRKQGLEPTGNLNLRTLKALGFDNPLRDVDMNDGSNTRNPGR